MSRSRTGSTRDRRGRARQRKQTVPAVRQKVSQGATPCWKISYPVHMCACVCMRACVCVGGVRREVVGSHVGSNDGRVDALLHHQLRVGQKLCPTPPHFSVRMRARATECVLFLFLWWWGVEGRTGVGRIAAGPPARDTQDRVNLAASQRRRHAGRHLTPPTRQV
jgi:hypothetical protein